MSRLFKSNAAVVVPWHDPYQRDKWLEAWNVPSNYPGLFMQYDKDGKGCAVTKNRGISAATNAGAEVVVVLDDDCYPDTHRTLDAMVERHLVALKPQSVRMFQTVTSPASRGTPYLRGNLDVVMPVAASIGFWTEIGDYCAVRQLAFDGETMQYVAQTIHGKYFPLCGMNIAFRTDLWGPFATFIDVPRYDDIWMGWLWQKYAYSRGFCFNYAGPLVRHSRQSNVWANLEHEAKYAEQNDSVWKTIATHGNVNYIELNDLLPHRQPNETI